MEHVLEKMEEEAVEGASNSGSSVLPLPEDRVKLFCLDNHLSPDMDLRTVRNMMWKGPGDLVITYSITKSG